MSKKSQNIPSVAIVGRPNVGKSSLFNRFVGYRKAIINEEMGTTRDRLYEILEWKDRFFSLVDTGGHKLNDEDPLSELVNAEVIKGIHEADLILFMIERDNISSEDYYLADIVKKLNKKVILVVNKIDHDNLIDLNEMYRLGFGEGIMISAMHNSNIDALMKAIVDEIPESSQIPKQDYDFTLTFIGEPNAGKSTLLNAILQYERSIVSEVAGTTRDNVHEMFTYQDKTIRLTDTAGIKPVRKIKDTSSFFSLSRAKKAISNTDVIALLFDYTRGPQKDTRRIYDLVEQAKKTCVLVVNKWDLSSHIEMSQYKSDLYRKYAFLENVPIVFISAKTGRNIPQLLDLCCDLADRHAMTVSTSELNQFLQKLSEDRGVPSAVNLKYIVQACSKPPKFILFCSNKKLLKPSHIQYMKKQIIKNWKLYGIFPDIIFK